MNTAMNIKPWLGLAMCLLVSLGGAPLIADEDVNSDWSMASSQAHVILGEDATALLAKVAFDAPDPAKSVLLIWAIGENKGAVNGGEPSDARRRIFHVGAKQRRSIDEELSKPYFIKQIKDLPSRTTVSADSDYLILFVRIGDENVILRSDHPIAIANIRSHARVSEEQAIANLHPIYRPMIACWAAIEHVFNPIIVQP